MLFFLFISVLFSHFHVGLLKQKYPFGSCVDVAYTHLPRQAFTMTNTISLAWAIDLSKSNSKCIFEWIAEQVKEMTKVFCRVHTEIRSFAMPSNNQSIWVEEFHHMCDVSYVRMTDVFSRCQPINVTRVYRCVSYLLIVSRLPTKSNGTQYTPYRCSFTQHSNF